jgi:biopolymer transport protein ExbD
MNLQIQRKRPRIELVPMIDVLFFIVVFFMLFATLNGAQTGIPINLPKALHLGNVVENTIVISITGDARIYLGKQSMGLDQLKQQVKTELQNNPETRIIVRPDAVVTYQKIVTVMDALASVGAEKPLLGVDRQQIPNSTKLNLN